MNDEETVEVARGDLVFLIVLAIKAASLAGYLGVTYAVLIDIAKTAAPWKGAHKAAVMYASVATDVPAALRRKMCVVLTGSDVHTEGFVCESCGGA